jgi:hypothetical protein
MHTSAIAIWAIVIVAVAGLAIWLTAIARAARKPYQDPHVEPLRGPVQGGAHVGGGGRSVAPRRDEAVTPDTGTDTDTDTDEPEYARRANQ